MSQLGAVVIGRNEGQRLQVCLASVLRDVKAVVYVDSGSSDGSVALAKSMNVEVVELDRSIPFTAARARNCGVQRLLECWPEVTFVQFVDGDCELIEGWLDASYSYMSDHPHVAVTCGRRRERHPERSVYNRLCDMEWNTAQGVAEEFGGDALVRVSAFQQVGGYRAAQIAGEEPEMAVRLRQRGWQIVRLGYDMTWHDVNMTRFGQWWRRTVRSGHALAERATLHGHDPERDCVKDQRSTLLWGGGVPLLTVLACGLAGPWGLLLLGGYGWLLLRVFLWRRGRGDGVRHCLEYAVFCVGGKIPQLVGLATYHRNRMLGRVSGIIEYHRPVTPRNA